MAKRKLSNLAPTAAPISRRTLVVQGTRLAATGAVLWAVGPSILPLETEAQTGSGPPFDFADAYYLAHGIRPDKLMMRVDGMPPDSVIDNHVPGPNFRNVRILNTTGGFDHGGSVLYYVITAMIPDPSVFTADQAGADARVTADTSFAYIFPKQSGDPLSPDPSNRRQDNVFDTTTYFGTAQDPLGLWTIVFVSYTAAALGTAAGQAALAALASHNGTDLDGTPVLAKKSQIVDLQKQGFVELRTRAKDGSQGFPWVI